MQKSYLPALLYGFHKSSYGFYKGSRRSVGVLQEFLQGSFREAYHLGFRFS